MEEYIKEDIIHYIFSERAKMTKENHEEVVNRYSNYYKMVKKITIQVKKDIVDSLKRIVSILHQYYGVPVTDKDMYLIFPRGFLDIIILMQKRGTYLPREYCDVTSISFEGYDNDDPIIHFSGVIHDHHSLVEYVAGPCKEMYMGSKEIVYYPETDLHSYILISDYLHSLIDPYDRSGNVDKWVALFEGNSVRFRRR